MSSFIALANQLKDRIWFTRIARIYSEKRLLRNEFHSQLLLMVYSIYSIALSVVLLKYKPISDDAGAVFGIVLTVTLFGLSFHMSSRGFSGRAQRFKENYTHLQELQGRLELATADPKTESIQSVIREVQEEYRGAIAGCENHGTIDDRCARFLAVNLSSRQLTKWDYVCVAGYSCGRYAILSCLYLLPPIVFSYLLLSVK